MKKYSMLLVSVFCLVGTSLYAADEEVAENIFLEWGRGTSKVPFAAGCRKAKKAARAAAKSACYTAGYTLCEEVETYRNYRSGSNPLKGIAMAGPVPIPVSNKHTGGVCGYVSVYEGITKK